MDITVSALWYTLIKGTSGISLSTEGQFVEVDERGIKNDRRWLIVDERGMFVAQRKGSVKAPLVGQVSLPSALGAGVEILSMCRIAAKTEGGELVISAPEMTECRLPLLRAVAPIVTVQVWSNPSLTAVDEGKDASAWLSDFLSRERPGTYRLVRIARDCRRLSKTGGAALAFQDAYPFMMMSYGSLGVLNGKLLSKGEDVVCANRFRPNIWFSRCEPHEEDFLKRFRIGEIEFQGGKLCDRCAVTCTDQRTGKRGREPLATLAEYRKGEQLAKLHGYEDAEGLGILAKPNGVFFGKNFDHLNTGVLRVGDSVEIP